MVAAGVCWDLSRLSPAVRRSLTTLNDSKRVSRAGRAELATRIWRHADRVVVRVASNRTIDRDGLHVTNLSLLRALLQDLEASSDALLVDGFSLGAGAPDHRAIVRGDAKSAAIAAASIIAKTVRDELMRGPVANRYPEYGFGQHVGYGTAQHLDRIGTHGICALHRRSFRFPHHEPDASPGLLPPVPG